MSEERVPRHGKADVAFAGAQLKDAWFLIASVFIAMVVGSMVGWLAYVGIPMLGYIGTKAYIQWKGKRLPGHCRVILYRLGIAGYSKALNRKKKLFIGDAKVVNPASLHMGAVARAEAELHQEKLVSAPVDESSSEPVEKEPRELVG